MSESSVVTLELDSYRPVLHVASSGAWFEVENEGRVSLDKYRVLQRVLGCLVTCGRSPASLDVVFQGGWPNERIRRRAAENRVYTAIHTLRRMGLRRVLAFGNGGYVLDARVVVVTESLLLPTPLAACAAEAQEQVA